MDLKNDLSRRRFVGGLSAAIGALGLGPTSELLARTPLRITPRLLDEIQQQQAQDYDSIARLNNNENCWGPPEAVVQAMTGALKYANRYGYPDPGLNAALLELHGIKKENLLFGSGSGEILDVVGATFLGTDKKVLSVEPTYGSVYSYATSIKSDAIKVPLLPDFNQDIPGLIKAAHRHYREIGFIYLCNPNNPTAKIVSSKDVKTLLDGIPEDVPVLIDEAYHHFVEDPSYSTSIPYVLEGRQVIVARTFSKIAALAGMRLGYAVAPPELITAMQNHSTGTLNVLARYAGAAALKDKAGEANIRQKTVALRKKAIAELEGMGYPVIPSDANFFMVSIKREVRPVIDEFRKKLIAVGRPFPPMNQYLRVSVGTEAEMQRFSKAFKEIFANPPASASAGAKGG